MTTLVSLADYYTAYDRVQAEATRLEASRRLRRTALQNCLAPASRATSDGFARMQLCRTALDSLDRRGWQRSFHQRMFHDCFIRACARIFWKREQHGAFAKNHQRILEVNGWDHLSQEVLVSTPRRSGPPRERGRVLAREPPPVGAEVVGGQARDEAGGHRGRHGVAERVERDRGPHPGHRRPRASPIGDNAPPFCRFGKTISVSMFAAAMLYSCPGLEMSIYSTCKVRARTLLSPPDFTDAAPAAHLAEAAAQRAQVSGADLHRARHAADEGGPGQHGGDRPAGRGGLPGRAHGQLLP